jgi:SAM-dependent methyltransferase
MPMSAAEFYDALTPYYHLIYANWDEEIETQATKLDSIIREIWGEEAHRVLDVACGIGTQALGLARLYYDVTASDISPKQVERAQEEANARELAIKFSVADMLEAHAQHPGPFNIILACDNALLHLGSEHEVHRAFQQFYASIEPGGGCLVSVAEPEAITEPVLQPCAVRVVDGVRWVFGQVWEPRSDSYDVTLYVIQDKGEAQCSTVALQSTQYAIGSKRLMELMEQAGFQDVQRIDGRYVQPVIVGTRPHEE